MLSSQQLKHLHLCAQWLFVFVLLVCTLQPASAAAQPRAEVSSAASGGTETWRDTFVAPEVAGRLRHTAVWTGTEMIVWGGAGGSGILNSGLSYNPATGVWKTISNVNAPAARTYHTAIWTGTEMIIWGGYGISSGSGSNYLNTGGIYNPVTDTWRAISDNNAPDARGEHTAVWTGTEMLVWGGEGSGPSYLNTGGSYNPASNTWASISTDKAPTARARHTAVWTSGTANPQMIIWGGKGDGGVVSTGGAYDPDANTWTALSIDKAPLARNYHNAVWTGTKMIVWGGEAAVGDLFNTGGQYDPASDSWTGTSIDNVPPARHEHTAVWTGTEMIIWGGNDYYNYFSTGGRYNPVEDTWTTLETIGLPSARYLHTAVWTGNSAGEGEMIIWGGGLMDGGIANTGGRYDPNANRWSHTPTSLTPSARIWHAAVWTGTEMIVWGGGTYNTLTNTGGRYNPTTNTWATTSTTGAPEAREEFAVVWAGDASGEGEMIIWGGNNGYSCLNTGGRYNPKTNTWKATSTADGTLQCRNGAETVWTGTEMIVWGGSDFHNSFTTGARYNPKTDQWMAMSTVNAPPAWASHAAVWTGSEMIVWSGSSSSGDDINNGARYNPSTDTWTTISTLNAPDKRYRPTVVWTGKEMLIWGGWTRTRIDDYNFIYGFVNTGGRYDPVTDTWKPITLNNAPNERADHTAVWTGKEMIIWGGGNGHGGLNTGGRYNPLTDTWVATDISGAPAARSEHTAVWTGKQMIIWGGTGGTILNTGGIYQLASDQYLLYMPMLSLNIK